MKNFIFISPAFPTNYENFCAALKENGVNVLGIGDTPYDTLSDRLKSTLTEYYKVENMQNYDEMFRAVAFLSFRHGKIDWLESNNEYWLEQDARLREDFNIPGLSPKDMTAIKFKSEMKAGYKKAGVPTARHHLVSDLAAALSFVKEVGYPVIVKPNCGVGASDTWKIHNEQELRTFYCNLPHVQYIMEEFVPGEICSYDAIVNSKGAVLFETGNITPLSIMDCVNGHEDAIRFYIVDKLADDLKEYGRACVKAFKIRSRFVHLEFFRLSEDHDYLGKKGQVVALEVNMRPCGGPTPDMINYAYNTNCYQHWADMMIFDKLQHITKATPCFCAFVGRWKEVSYAHSHEDITNTFQSSLKAATELPEVLAHGMGNFMYIAKLETTDAREEFFRYVLEETTPKTNK
ncbi:MAG: ATP-grasp domain-containing protein [Lachnospiraceae bacterium]|nr:ATP-grasp domain-containing protein [Lachnospiraceae bacterium]